MQRVVVTGLGVVSPLGNDVKTSWENLLAGKTSAGPLTRYDVEKNPTDTTFACEVKDFDDSEFLDKKSARRLEPFTRYAMYASHVALRDAGLTLDGELAERTGVIIGVGLGGLRTLEDNHSVLLEKGPSRINPFMIPVLIANMAAGQVSIATGARGPNICTTSACASGLHGIGTAYSEILLGRAEVMIAGGSESTITPMAVGGFNAMKALSTRNDDPATASRPFDRDRDGFVMGEGAGVLILETLERAKARGARIYAEIIGYGASGDAYHMAAPPEDGSGMALAMRAALRDARVNPEIVDHVNAHATSTPVGDMCEIRALRTVFGEHARKLTITANKSQIGHCLGAAGAIESVFSIMSIADGKVPGTANVSNLDPECDLDCLITGSRDQDVRSVLCNSFGFGGTNCSIIYAKYAD
ncbi:3-oxoacyl-(acyl-carrier-protein) synthase 2 [Alkalidesulfovibrio alkalitolerans DSM 16529]|uniref:3-oxoacyl-[acyl-carrier-protein] synthase 2 n=1 Tax=Alkalidesulfovibrio alkalitolerans DSM 16529 TaxID=1121439 RepID=S7T8U6_9BACT|nr:3-oxoacyl-(acyl-carrier-protein) synthase 2 [Alkalidesulfovibrio alkalitolerans DSM 16529]